MRRVMLIAAVPRCMHAGMHAHRCLHAPIQLYTYATLAVSIPEHAYMHTCKPAYTSMRVHNYTCMHRHVFLRGYAHRNTYRHADACTRTHLHKRTHIHAAQLPQRAYTPACTHECTHLNSNTRTHLCAAVQHTCMNSVASTNRYAYA